MPAAFALLLQADLLPAQGRASTTPTAAVARSGNATRAKAARTTPAPPAAPIVLPTTVAPAVVIPSASTTPSVVSILVPDAIPASSRVTYTVTPLIEGAVIGKLTGALGPAAAKAGRNVLFAARTPRQLPAGDVQLALVRFTTQAAAVEVPIVARVDFKRDLRITPGSNLQVARQGVPFTVTFRVSNLGNAADTVALQFGVPSGWRVIDQSASHVVSIPMLGSVDRQLQVVPAGEVSGAPAVRLTASVHGAPVAEARVEVHVPGNQAATRRSGPVLTFGAAAASGPWDELAHLRTIELDGQLSDGMRVWARASTAPWRQGAASYAFARANVLSAPAALQLSSADWKVGAGTIGTTVSELAGVNLVGEGASVAITRPDWQLRGIVASPDVGARDAEGSILGGRLDASPGRYTFSAAVSRLRESRYETRALDAVSLGGGMDGLLGGKLSAEVARRQFDDRAEPGWSASYSRRSPDDNLDFRYVRAPGGSRAFARNSGELAASGSRRLWKGASLSGSYWKSTDEGAESLSGLDLDGWALGGQFALGAGLQGSLTARRSAFGATTPIGDFGTDERGLDASFDARRGSVVAQLTMTASRVRRTTLLGDSTGSRFVQEAPRAGVRGGLGIGGEHGLLSLTGQYDRSGAGVGYAPVQWSYGVELGRAVIPGVTDKVRLTAAFERMGGFESAVGQTVLRAGFEAELPASSRLTMAAERNPWIAPGDGGGRWMFVAGISRAISLPRFSSSGSRGVVFRDLNGNGSRDAGEDGLPGVLIRRGPDMATSDGDGRFVLGGDVSQPFEIDARSLPLGWLVSSTEHAPGTRIIGVIPVSPLTVELVLEAPDTGRVVTADLSEVVVIARDSTGRAWLARRTTGTMAVFDALPPGTYTVDIDATAVREPLRVTRDLPSVTISGRPIAPIRIPLRTRTLKFSTPGVARVP